MTENAKTINDKNNISNNLIIKDNNNQKSTNNIQKLKITENL